MGLEQGLVMNCDKNQLSPAADTTDTGRKNET